MAQQRHESFSKQMRVATRKIHKISDDLVNAKIAFAMSDNNVWAEGLLVFYEIFRYLEENTSPLILPLEFHRSLSFVKDLTFYLGNDWKKDYKPRESVQKYLAHLEKTKEKNPLLLLAYVYHLYMGLLSGGQILQKKRSFAQAMAKPFKGKIIDSNNSDGQAVTTFDLPIFELKQKMRNSVDEMAREFDENIKTDLLIESQKCFEMNNEIVRTVKGVNTVGLRKFFLFLFILTVICCLYFKFM